MQRLPFSPAEITLLVSAEHNVGGQAEVKCAFERREVRPQFAAAKDVVKGLMS
jgi:hypothetical protein